MICTTLYTRSDESYLPKKECLNKIVDIHYLSHGKDSLLFLVLFIKRNHGVHVENFGFNRVDNLISFPTIIVGDF